ncbi:MAG: hypothetical protein K2Q18_00210 [Bdellovibrionales bacterium]|nr:hypothetical protein [Bdellovibrionales bacterium]
MKNKPLFFLILLSLSISVTISAADAEDRRGPPGRGHRPELTEEQKTCLEGKLGPKDSGTRPARAVMDMALSECGVEKPKEKPKEESQSE